MLSNLDYLSVPTSAATADHQRRLDKLLMWEDLVAFVESDDDVELKHQGLFKQRTRSQRRAYPPPFVLQALVTGSGMGCAPGAMEAEIRKTWLTPPEIAAAIGSPASRTAQRVLSDQSTYINNPYAKSIHRRYARNVDNIETAVAQARSLHQPIATLCGKEFYFNNIDNAQLGAVWGTPLGVWALAECPYVLFIDATYKIDASGCPLLLVSVLMPCNSHFPALYIQMKSETTDAYDEAIKHLRSLCFEGSPTRARIKECAVATDGAVPLANALAAHMPEWTHVLCAWHVERTARQAMPADLQKDFQRLFFGAVRATQHFDALASLAKFVLRIRTSHLLCTWLCSTHSFVARCVQQLVSARALRSSS